MELERYTPGLEGAIWYEHWHRYHFVAPLADGRRVLDIACGEGYGSALLAGRAKQVTGVDADAGIVAHARKRYGAIANLEFRDGRCEAMPLADESVDLVVSFETLEHIADPEKLIAEAARVLAPGGLFVVSTPNKEIYSDVRGYRNPHHVHEFQHDEFVAVLAKHFPAAKLFGQRVDTFSAIWALDGESGRGQLLDAKNSEAGQPRPGIADPMYFVAVCGRDAAQVSEAARGFSLLSDRDHAILRDHESVFRQLGEAQAHSERIEAAYLAAQQQLAALAQERERLLARLGQLERPAPAPGPSWRRS